MSIQRVRAMKKRQAADLKKRQARAKALKDKLAKAKADKAKADKDKSAKEKAAKAAKVKSLADQVAKAQANTKKAASKVKAKKPPPAPKKKVATKKAPIKRRAPVKREAPVKAKAPVKRRAPVKREAPVKRDISVTDQQIQPEQEGGTLAKQNAALSTGTALGNRMGSRGPGGSTARQARREQRRETRRETREETGQRFPRVQRAVEGVKDVVAPEGGIVERAIELGIDVSNIPRETLGTVVDAVLNRRTQDPAPVEERDTPTGTDPAATTTTEGVEYEPQGEAVPRDEITVSAGPSDRPWETGRHGSFVEEYTPMKATLDQGTGYNQPAGPVTGGVELPMEYQGSNQYGGDTAGPVTGGPTPGGSTAGGSTGQTGGGNYPIGLVPGTTNAPNVGTGSGGTSTGVTGTGIDSSIETGVSGADTSGSSSDSTIYGSPGVGGSEGSGVVGTGAGSGGVGGGGGGVDAAGYPIHPMVDQTERQERLARTTTTAEQAAKGIFPTTEGGEQPTKIPDPEKLATEDMEGKVVEIDQPDYDAFAADFTQRIQELQGDTIGDVQYTYDKLTGQIVQTDPNGKQTFHGTPEDFAKARDLNLEEFKARPSAEGAQAGDIDDETVTKGVTQEAQEQEDIKASTYEEIKAGLYGEVRIAEDGTVIDPGGFIGTPVQAAAALENYDVRSNATPTEIRDLTERAKAASISEEEAEGRKAELAEFKISEPVYAEPTLDEEGNVIDPGGQLLDGGAFVPPVKGERPPVSATVEAERSERELITDEAAQKDAAKIINDIGWEAKERSVVTGDDAIAAAANAVAETINIPPEIAEVIVKAPAEVEAKIDEGDVIVTAAVAAMDPTMLVSAQMKGLVGSLEKGEIPIWAQPAVDGINQRMAERGLDVSTVGRDALFNAVITQAFPMAQSQAQALQARAEANLGREQQAEVEQKRLDMTRRMANLANEQRAESETAQFAQNMQEMQSQFNLQTTMATEAQEQQVRMQNLENKQQAAMLESQNQQEANALQLGADSQMDLAQLRVDAEKAGADQSFENQRRMSEYQVAADFLAKNEGFTQQMRLANMSEDNQMRLANLASKNQHQSELMSNDEKVELANLNTRMQTNLLEGRLASEMGVAQLSVDQQRAVQNASMIANIDMAKFTTEQQVILTNSKWMQTASLTNLNNRQQAAIQDATALAALDLAAVDQRTKASINNARNFLAWDTSNLTNSQQANMLQAQMDQQALLSDQAAGNAAQQFNSTSENQTNQFMTGLAQQVEINNASRFDAMEQFNANSENAAEARRSARDADIEKFNAGMTQDINKYNNTIDFQRDTWNAQNAAAVEAGNVAWRRRANEIDTATDNAVNMQNSMNSFKMSTQANAFLWQELRDQADFDFRHYEADQQRRASVIISAIGSGDAYKEDFWQTNWNEMLTAALGEI